MRLHSTRDQIAQELTTIGHRTAFNNEQSSHQMSVLIVNYVNCQRYPRQFELFIIITRKNTLF